MIKESYPSDANHKRKSVSFERRQKGRGVEQNDRVFQGHTPAVPWTCTPVVTVQDNMEMGFKDKQTWEGS